MEAASARFHQGMPRPVALAMLLAAELRPMREQDFQRPPFVRACLRSVLVRSAIIAAARYIQIY
jgi:hypothetical protein